MGVTKRSVMSSLSLRLWHTPRLMFPNFQDAAGVQEEKHDGAFEPACARTSEAPALRLAACFWMDYKPIAHWAACAAIPGLLPLSEARHRPRGVPAHVAPVPVSRRLPGYAAL